MRTSDHWAPYAPDSKLPWSLQRVVHLHRRAGFAATWAELQRDLKDGPAASVDRQRTGPHQCLSPLCFEGFSSPGESRT